MNDETNQLLKLQCFALIRQCRLCAQPSEIGSEVGEPRDAVPDTINVLFAGRSCGDALKVEGGMWKAAQAA